MLPIQVPKNSLSTSAISVSPSNFPALGQASIVEQINIIIGVEKNYNVSRNTKIKVS